MARFFLIPRQFHLQVNAADFSTAGSWGGCLDKAGPKRHSEPGIRWEDLPPIDAVLVSHSHYDHPTLGNSRLLQKADLTQVSELDWCMLLCLSGGQDLEKEKQGPIVPVLRQKQKQPRHGVRAGLFQPWFHLHLWEAARLPGFRADALVLFQLLRGIATPAALGKSVRYLLSEGFLRRTLDGRIVPDHPSLETTDEVPSEHIRKLHVRALELAARLTGELPIKEREAGMVLMSLNEDGFQKLKTLIKNFNETLTQFSEENAASGDCLYQVIVNAVPVSVRSKGESKL
jgi:hypothetical protein